ncbi:MAG: DUF927 domain-containing protein [Clostridia bacterium]|nr:DUF927 domain-containing protein [Clostridia bacterium]
MFVSYDFEDFFTVVFDEHENKSTLCQQISVVAVKTDVDDKKQTLVIEIRSGPDSSATFEMPRGNLYRNLLPTLGEYGLRIADDKDSISVLQEILLDTEKGAAKSFSSKALGYHYVNGQRCYLLDRDLCGKFNLESTCANLVSPSGNFRDWHAGVAPLMQSHPPFALGVAIGATAPLTYRLKSAGISLGAPIFALVGETTSGKTTTLQVCNSIFGIPDEKGLTETMNATESWFYATLAGRNGVIVGFDETTIGVVKDPSSLIYTMAGGKERGRCSSDGSRKDPKTWSTSILLTGENSLLAQSSKKGGLFARLIEFRQNWTRTKQDADQVLKTISTNYGVAAAPLINTIEAISDEDLLKRFKDCNDELLQNIPAPTQLTGRIVKKLALLLLSCDVISKAWDVNIDRSAIIQILVDELNENLPLVDPLDRFYEGLHQEIAQNPALFPHASTNKVLLGQMKKHGVIEVINGKTVVWLYCDWLDPFLDRYGLDSSPQILRKMEARKMILKRGDRFKDEKAFGGVCAKSVCIPLKTNPLPTPVKKKPSKNPHTANHNLLLDDDDETPDKPEYDNNGGAEE